MLNRFFTAKQAKRRAFKLLQTKRKNLFNDVMVHIKHASSEGWLQCNLFVSQHDPLFEEIVKKLENLGYKVFKNEYGDYRISWEFV